MKRPQEHVGVENKNMNIEQYGTPTISQRVQRFFRKKVWYKARIPLPAQPSEEEQ